MPSASGVAGRKTNRASPRSSAPSNRPRRPRRSSRSFLMCGIVGVIGSRDVVPLLVDGLKRLEYRGYDSAGIATLSATGAIERPRAAGKIVRLEGQLRNEPRQSLIGLPHTRWAPPDPANAPNTPHTTAA